MNSRTRYFWYGLFLQAAGWQFLLPLFTPPSSAGIILLFAGAILNGFSLSEKRWPLGGSALVSYACASVLLLLLAPYPHCLAGVILLIGSAALWISRSSNRLSGLGYGILITGVISAFQSFLLPFLMQQQSKWHEIPLLSSLLSCIFTFCGFKTQHFSSSFFVQGSTGIHEFAINSEYFGILFLVNIAFGLLAWQALCNARNKLRTFCVFAGVAGLYAIARYMLLSFLYLELRIFSLFWDPWIFCISFLPCFLILFLLQGRAKEQGLNPPLTSFGRKEAFGATAVGIAVFALVLAWGLEDPGAKKAGRVIIDEKHSRWELMDRKYDTAWYGEESGYNYYCLLKYLEHFYKVHRNTNELTSESLQNCDLLIIKVPTSQYTEEEIDAIEKFVQRGGGLLLIGDHTNVFGTSTHLNPIAKRFGMRYNYDATYDLASGKLSVFDKPRLLPHPIIQRMPRFLFGTSCTLDVSLGAQVPINGYGLRVAGHDYSEPSFFTRNTDGPYVGFGMFPQLAALNCKQGRVVAFTDSTVFSNFWMFMPGKAELMLGMTEWLNRANRYSWDLSLLWIVGGVLSMVAIFSLKERFGPLGLPFAVMTVSFFIAAHVSKTLNEMNYTSPRPHTAFKTICFDRELSNYALPSETIFITPKLDYHTFYTWVQRVGYVPQTSPSHDDALKQGDALVIINPKGKIPLTRLQQLREYVRKGGVLFVLDAVETSEPAANALLGLFDCSITGQNVTGKAILNSGGQLLAANQQTRVTIGGEGMAFVDKTNAVISIKREGKGTIAFTGTSELFANTFLGTSNNVPDDKQKALYELIFSLFRLIESKGTQSTETQNSPSVAK